MMIAGTAGLLYARDLARGYIMGALGGLVIGAACGIAAVASANVLGDQPEQFIPYGVMICALVGAIGGLFGQYAAWIREFIAHAWLRRAAPLRRDAGGCLLEKLSVGGIRPGKGLGGLLIRADSQPTDD